MRIIGFCLVLFLTFGFFAYDSSANDDKGIVMYVGGKKYDSFRTYQLQKLMNILDESFEDCQDECLSLFDAPLKERVIAKNFNDLSVDEIEDAIKELNDIIVIREMLKKEGEKNQPRKIIDISQMQKDGDYSNSKMKTILISPDN